MTGTKMELQFVKACSNLVDNTVMEEIMQKNLEEIESCLLYTSRCV